MALTDLIHASYNLTDALGAHPEKGGEHVLFDLSRFFQLVSAPEVQRVDVALGIQHNCLTAREIRIKSVWPSRVREEDP